MNYDNVMSNFQYQPNTGNSTGNIGNWLSSLLGYGKSAPTPAVAQAGTSALATEGTSFGNAGNSALLGTQGQASGVLGGSGMGNTTNVFPNNYSWSSPAGMSDLAGIGLGIFGMLQQRDALANQKKMQNYAIALNNRNYLEELKRYGDQKQMYNADARMRNENIARQDPTFQNRYTQLA